MVLYVTPVADPPPGVDFTYLVPGQYVETILAVQATLTTGPDPGGLPGMIDSGPGASDGVYVPQTTLFPFPSVPGVVAGNNGFAHALVNPGSAWGGAKIISPAVDFTASTWSVGMWVTPTPGDTQLSPFNVTANAGAISAITVAVTGSNAGDVTRAHDVAQPSDIWTRFPLAVTPYGFGPMFVCLVFDDPMMTLYINGAAVTWGTVPPVVHPININPDTPACSFQNNSDAGVDVYDEWCFWQSALSAGEVANLHNAGLAGFASWVAELISSNALDFYHMDEQAPARAGVTPGLAITNSTDLVAVVSVPAQQANLTTLDYTWLAGSTPGAGAVTPLAVQVGMPSRTLPPGYTLGSRTPALASLDQWSNIFVWWDDGQDVTPIDPWDNYDDSFLVFLSQQGG